MNPVQYFEEALSLFQDLPFFHRDQLKLANRRVQLCTPSAVLRDKFLPALSHLTTEKCTDPVALTIWYAESSNLSKRLKAPPWAGFDGQGYNKTLDQEEVQIFFQPWQQQIFLYSNSRKIGIYWVQKADEVPWWESTFSFRAIFHLWTRDLPAQLLHAGAMAMEGTGVLIPGQSGSGKSTSCLNLLEAGYQYLGDDYVWVEIGEQIQVFTLYQCAKIEADNLQERFKDWIPNMSNPKDYKTQKAIFYLKKIYPKRVIHSVAIKDILLPRVTQRDFTSFKRINPINTLIAMAPTTLHHLPHNRQISYDKMLKIVTSLPAYQWLLGHDKGQFIKSFEHFITNEIANR